MVWAGFAPVEGRRWLALALDLADKDTVTELLAKIHYASAAVAGTLAEPEIELTSSEKALALYRDVGDSFGIARSQVKLGNALKNLGRSKEAEPILLEGLAKLRELGPCYHLGYALRVMSQVSLGKGDFATARRHLAEALAISKVTGAHRFAAVAVATDSTEVELTQATPASPFDSLWIHYQPCAPITTPRSFVPSPSLRPVASPCLTMMGRSRTHAMRSSSQASCIPTPTSCTLCRSSQWSRHCEHNAIRSAELSHARAPLASSVSSTSVSLPLHRHAIFMIDRNTNGRWRSYAAR